ncbi:hypothetical protein JQC92_13015 [Shewanella sp. 202IG2-18]|uniref:hypothetical protein n=1 Tax=Parashewanella hymeniacidonis TaxID=2807618 RepID=UPI00195FE3E1|nr:hypothetical protein [Parashewanella hymeniacidonis]MBM7072935.1 hypothetical protein [Parashewanella hymeniacidonis]
MEGVTSKAGPQHYSVEERIVFDPKNKTTHREIVLVGQEFSQDEIEDMTNRLGGHSAAFSLNVGAMFRLMNSSNVVTKSNRAEIRDAVTEMARAPSKGFGIVDTAVSLFNTMARVNRALQTDPSRVGPRFEIIKGDRDSNGRQAHHAAFVTPGDGNNKRSAAALNTMNLTDDEASDAHSAHQQHVQQQQDAHPGMTALNADTLAGDVKFVDGGSPSDFHGIFFAESDSATNAIKKSGQERDKEEKIKDQLKIETSKQKHKQAETEEREIEATQKGASDTHNMVNKMQSQKEYRELQIKANTEDGQGAGAA